MFKREECRLSFGEKNEELRGTSGRPPREAGRVGDIQYPQTPSFPDTSHAKQSVDSEVENTDTV